MSLSSTMSFTPFLRLPLEIRDQIYSYLLVPHTTHATDPHTHDTTAHHSFDLSLLLVSHQIHTEALQVFRRLNTFVLVSTPWPDAYRYTMDDGRVPILITGDRAHRFKNVHLHVRISATTNYTDGGDHRFVILLQDLEKFTTVWFYSDLSQGGTLNSHLEMTLLLQHPYSPSQNLPKTLQEKLLMPFTMIKGLHKTRIEGEGLNADVATAMREKQDEPYKSIEACLDEATTQKDLGNIALQKQQYDAAIKHYEAAFLALHIVCQGRSRQVWGNAYFEALCKEGQYQGQSAQMVRLILRVKLVANMVLAYLKKEEWEEAKFWGMRSILLMREGMGVDEEDEDQPMLGFAAANEMGKIYYRTGLAAKALGQITEARSLLKVARGYLPHDMTVMRDYTSVAPRI